MIYYLRLPFHSVYQIASKLALDIRRTSVAEHAIEGSSFTSKLNDLMEMSETNNTG